MWLWVKVPHVWKIELMNNKLINTLLPLNKEGELDRRYEDNIKSILSELGSENVDVLSSFYENTTKLEKEAGNAALQLALCILKHVEDLDKNHKFDSNDNFIGWKSKSIRKRLSESIQRLGFKPKNAHKIVMAAEFKHALISSNCWIESLGVSHFYELSRMNDQGFKYALEQARDPEFHFKAGAYKDVSVRRLEEIRRMFPKLETPDIKPSQLTPAVDVEVVTEPSSITEESLAPTQQELVDQLIPIIQAMNLDEIYGNIELKAKLEVVRDPLMTLAHIAIPTPTRPTYV